MALLCLGANLALVKANVIGDFGSLCFNGTAFALARSGTPSFCQSLTITGLSWKASSNIW